VTALTSRVDLGPVGQIPPGEGRTFEVAGQPIAVFRLRSGTLRAISAICSHAGGPLADGQIDEDVVICPLHLNAFELATGCSRSGQPDLAVFTVHAEDSRIVLEL